MAAVFRRVLAVERVEANDDFFALGGTSLLVPQLVLELRRATGVEIAHSAIGSGRTVAELAREVEAVRSSGAALPASSPPAPDLRAAAALPRSLRFHPPRRPPAARVALLTGATGFLGSHLLVELLRSGTEPVFCLVRAASAREARRRLEHAIARVGGVSPEAARRAVAVRSDLSRPMLGSSAADLRLLREQVTVIVHCGCWVNFTYPYAVLEATNVRATRTLLELAAESRVDFFHLVSTAGVFDPRGYPKGESIAESDDLERSASVRGGYSQTKWVADRMLRSARERGLSANVYRPGWISGHSRTAACNARDLIWNLVKGSIQLGLAPAIDFQIGFEPVDRVSRSIVHLARREQPSGRSYHLPESGSVHWLDIVGLLERRGYRLRKVPFESWRQELEAALARGADVALAPFAPLFAGESGSAEPFDWAGGPLLDRSSATAALDSAQLPRTDSLVQVEHHIGWLQRARFLPPPAAVSPIATP